MMAVRLAIPAVHALTLLPALHACPETLTVVFVAGGLLTRAFSSRNIGRDAFEVTRVSVVCHSLSVIDVRVI